MKKCPTGGRWKNVLPVEKCFVSGEIFLPDQNIFHSQGIFPFIGIFCLLQADPRPPAGHFSTRRAFFNPQGIFSFTARFFIIRVFFPPQSIMDDSEVSDDEGALIDDDKGDDGDKGRGRDRV